MLFFFGLYYWREANFGAQSVHFGLTKKMKCMLVVVVGDMITRYLFSKYFQSHQKSFLYREATVSCQTQDREVVQYK